MKTKSLLLLTILSLTLISMLSVMSVGVLGAAPTATEVNITPTIIHNGDYIYGYGNYSDADGV